MQAQVTEVGRAVWLELGGGVHTFLCCPFRARLPALRADSCSCNRSPPSRTILTPLPFLYALEEPAGVLKRPQATDRTLLSPRESTRGWDTGVSAGGEFSDLHGGD